MGTVGSLVSDVLYITLAVFCIIAIVRVLRDKDAALPLISKMAGGDFTATRKPKAKAAAAPTQVAPSMQAAPFGTQYAEPPAQASAPMPPPTTQAASGSAPMPPPATQAAPTPSVELCPACSAPLYENSGFCTKCGTQIQR